MPADFLSRSYVEISVVSTLDSVHELGPQTRKRQTVKLEQREPL
jgi:hypothetical protein